MREQPSGENLLEAARALLRDQLLASLPADKRHAALMVANAMAIAGRELRHGDAPDCEELASLMRLLEPQSAGAPNPPRPTRELLLELNRRLCRIIRHDKTLSQARGAAIVEHLRHVARRRVAESNPKYLAGAG